MDTAQDIRNWQFGTTFVGYDRGQVDAFRDEVAAVAEHLTARVDEVERQLREYEQSKPITADQAFAQVARETQRILQVAQDAGARILQQAREQAENELAVARREHAQIVDEGHRARDRIGEQIGQLDQARTLLLRRLYDANAEIERICTAVESQQPAGPQRTVDERMIESARTGTELAAGPRRSGEPALRVVASGGPRRQLTRVHSDAARGSRALREASAAPGARDAVSGRDPVSAKREHLTPLRTALIEGLRAELAGVSDRLREHLRQTGDDDQPGQFTWDPALLSRAAWAGGELLGRAFDLGARAAAGECGDAEPATRTGHSDAEPSTRDEHGDDVLAEVLDARIGAPIRTLLEHGRTANDPPWVVAERIDGVVTDAAEAMVAEIAETELSRAYERGKLATFGQESAARRWIVSPRGHRRDERCRRNGAVQALPPDEPFPSGEHAPPRFGGCTCTTSATKEERDP